LTVDGEAVDAEVSESDGVVKVTHDLEGIAGGAHTASVASPSPTESSVSPSGHSIFQESTPLQEILRPSRWA
jgi:hypothetical protein